MSERLLIAHPDPQERARLASIAAQAGFETVEVGDGEQAVARGRDCGVALLAATLPILDGLAAAARLRDQAAGDGPHIVLLNDVYPVAEPKERFLKDFALTQALPAPPTEAALNALLSRRTRRPARARREERSGVDIAEMPLLLLLGRARRKVETTFLYVRCRGEAIFLCLHRGDVASVRSNRPAAGGEEQVLADALLWTEGEAFSYPDPAIEDTTSSRLDLLPILERSSARPLPPPLEEAAARSLARASRVVFQPADAQAETAAILGLTHFERELIGLIDGERSISRIGGLTEAGALPLARLLLRLETLGVVARRRPGAKAGAPPPSLPPATALLPHDPGARVENTGWLEGDGLARMLLRLETMRSTGVLALKRGRRTVEIALSDGRLTGAHAWGGERSEDDPIQHLAEAGELRPEDVPALRRLHAQRLVLEALLAPRCEYALRRGEIYRMAETLGVNSASLVAELLRSGELRAPAGTAPSEDGFDTVAAALGLTTSEKSALEDFVLSGELPATAWLASLGPLLDPAAPIGHAAFDSSRALPAAPEEVEGKPPVQDLDALFEKALDQGLREGALAGARRAADQSEENTAAPAVTSEVPAASTGAAAVTAGAPAVRRDSEALTADAPAAVSSRTLPPPPSPPAAAPAAVRLAAAERSSTLPPRPPREAIPPLPEEDVPEDLSAFALTLGSGQGSPASFSMEQRSGGVVIRVGDREYAIDLLIKEAEELRRERNRLRGELARRHSLLVEREDEIESVRKTVHELENFIHELQATVADKEKTFGKIESSRGELDAMLAELQAVVPEKDRLLEEALARYQSVSSEMTRDRERIRERERALEDLKRERDGLKERAVRLDAEVKSRGEELREAEERLGVLKERSSRLEQDLSVARAEREDLIARLTASESDRKPRGFFRDARTERAASDERVESAQKLAEERRRALDAVRAELVTVSHRVIDLEGQVARRDAEVSRLQRERERLDEKLATAVAEAAARGESEAANRLRREEAERVLRERSTALELKGEELLGLRRLHEQVAAELTAARATVTERDRALETLAEQRSSLRARVAELEASAASLQTELSALREERERLEWTADEVRQTCERATSALEAVRAARDELGSRLSETIAAKAQSEEERERHLAEARRLDGELRREREQRAEETSTLSGKLVARDQEMAALARRLQTALSEHGALADRAAGLSRERDQALARAAATEQRIILLTAEVERLGREIEPAKADRQRAHELGETLSLRDAMILDLQDELQKKQAALDHQAQETINLLEKLQVNKQALEEKRRQEMMAAAEARRREIEQVMQRHQAESTALAAARESEQSEHERALEELKNRVLESENRIGAAMHLESELKHELQQRESMIHTLRGELERSGGERRRLAEELETRVASKVAHVQKLEAGLTRLKEEAIKEIGNWKARSLVLEQKLQLLTGEEAKQREAAHARLQDNDRLEAQMVGARKRIAQDVRRISELVAVADDQRSRIAERDAQIEAFRTELQRREEDRQRLEAEVQARSAEVDAFRETAADRERKLAEANNGMLTLSQHDRELSQQLAEQEELIANLKADLQRLGREKETGLLEMERARDAAATALVSREVEAARAPLLARIEQLHHSLEEKTTTETRLRAELEGLYEEMVSASQVIEEAQQQTSGLIGDMERRQAAAGAEEAALRRVQELEEQVRALQFSITERDEAYDLLDATVAARERLLEELERRVQSERERASAALGAASIEATLRAELAEAGRALAEAAAERDVREELKARLDAALAAGDLLREDLDRLRARRPPSPAAARPETPAAAAAARSADPELESVVREKQALLETSSRYNREVSRLRDAMERKNGELERIEDGLGASELAAVPRRELETARQAAEDEVHALQASLGVATVKMAGMNRQIVEKNRRIQQLIERHDERGEAAPQGATTAQAEGERAEESRGRGIEAAEHGEAENAGTGRRKETS